MFVELKIRQNIIQEFKVASIYEVESDYYGILNRAFSLVSSKPNNHIPVINSLCEELARKLNIPKADNKQKTNLDKTFKVGKEFWDSSHGLFSQAIREIDDHYHKPHIPYVSLRHILTQKYNSQDILQKLSKINLIGNQDAWELLQNLEDWKNIIW